MTRPLGTQQLKLLLAMGSPSLIMLTPPDRVAQSLIDRGYAGDWRNGGTRITPAGMRALADAYEAGLLEQFMSKRLK
jgi:hypothetical protein